MPHTLHKNLHPHQHTHTHTLVLPTTGVPRQHALAVRGRRGRAGGRGPHACRVHEHNAGGGAGAGAAGARAAWAAGRGLPAGPSWRSRAGACVGAGGPVCVCSWPVSAGVLQVRLRVQLCERGGELGQAQRVPRLPGLQGAGPPTWAQLVLSRRCAWARARARVTRVTCVTPGAAPTCVAPAAAGAHTHAGRGRCTVGAALASPLGQPSCVARTDMRASVPLCAHPPSRQLRPFGAPRLLHALLLHQSLTGTEPFVPYLLVHTRATTPISARARRSSSRA